MSEKGTIEPLSRTILERNVDDAAYMAAGQATGLTLAGYSCRARLLYQPAAFVDRHIPLVEAHIELTRHKLAYPDVTIRARAMGHAARGIRQEGVKTLHDREFLLEFASMTHELAGRDLAVVPAPEIEKAVRLARDHWQEIEPLALALIAGFQIPPRMIGDEDHALDEDEDDYPAP